MNSTEELPARFEDAAGRCWHVRLDFALLREIRRVAGIDIGNLRDIGAVWAELLFDDLKALETVWIAIGGAASKPGVGDEASYATADGNRVSKDDWLSAMDGTRLDDARHALREAIENFTPPLKRNLLQQGLGAVEKTSRLLIAEAEKNLKHRLETATRQAIKSVRHGKVPRVAQG